VAKTKPYVHIFDSNYWQWDCKCTTENIDLAYNNRIPQGIIDIFEKHGFIWVENGIITTQCTLNIAQSY